MSFRFQDVPDDSWGQIKYLMESGLPEVMQAATSWIETEYDQTARLQSSRDFLARHFVDGASANLETLERVWYFPWTEAAGEFQRSLACSLMGMHRNAFDCQRRALELAVVGALFAAEHIEAEKARAWMDSSDPTPMFTKAIAGVARGSFGEKLQQTTGWTDRLKQHYWWLCDIVHVRGTQFGSLEIEPSFLHFNSFPVPGFYPGALKRSLDAFVRTFEFACLMLAVANPLLLIPAPLFEKYGFNPPASGLYTDDQAQLFKELLPEPDRAPAVSIAEEEPGVSSVIEYIRQLPDITEEELEVQVQSIKDDIRRLNDMTPPADSTENPFGVSE